MLAELASLAAWSQIGLAAKHPFESTNVLQPANHG